MILTASRDRDTIKLLNAAAKVKIDCGIADENCDGTGIYRRYRLKNVLWQVIIPTQ
jgi:hypothetical protein